MQEKLEGRYVTIDYQSKKMYSGNLAVDKIVKQLRSVTVPVAEPVVPQKQAVAEDANEVYSAIQYHPNLLLMYEKEKAGGASLVLALGEVFDERITKLAEELNKISKEANAETRAGRLTDFVTGFTKEEKIIQEFFAPAISAITENKGYVISGQNKKELKERYFSDRQDEINSLRNEMERLLAGRNARDFIKDAFKRHMQDVLSANKGELVLHRLTSLDCDQLFALKGGYLVELVNPNPNYGIHNASRWVDDLAELNRLEMAAFQEVWKDLPVEERKNFGLEIYGIQGTQAGGIVIAWKYLLRGLGIIPGQDGLVVGLTMNTPTDTLVAQEYFRYFANLGTGLSFISFPDGVKLGAAWSGVDIYSADWRRTAKPEELITAEQVARKIVKAKVEAFNADHQGQTPLFEAVIRASKPVAVLTDGGTLAHGVIAPVQGAVSPDEYTISVSEAALPLDAQRVAQLRRTLDNALTTISIVGAERYGRQSINFGNFLYKVSALEKAPVAIVTAKAFVDDPAAVTAFLKTKKAVKFFVWAVNAKEAAEMMLLGVDKLAENVIVAGNFNQALEQAITVLKQSRENSKLPYEELVGRIVLFNAGEPMPLSVPVIVENLQQSDSVKGTINAFTLAIARGITRVISRSDKVGNDAKREVKAQFNKMADAYTARMASEQLDAVRNIGVDLTSMPTLQADDVEAKQQQDFSAAMQKIESAAAVDVKV
jgi:hypothetical protein